MWDYPERQCLGQFVELVKHLAVLPNDLNNLLSSCDSFIHSVKCDCVVVLQKKMYKDQLESMLVTHVFPEFQSPHGYMRARVRLSVDGGSFGFVKWRGNLSKLRSCGMCAHI